MKKTIGLLLIVFCSILLFIFGLSLIVLIPDLIMPDTESNISTSDAIYTLLGFALVIALLIFGLVTGIKKVKSVKPIEITPYNDTLNITLSGQLTYKDYRNLILRISYLKPVYLIFLGIIILSGVSIGQSLENSKVQLSSYYFVFVAFAVVFVTPLITLIRIKKNYKSSKIFQGPLEYHLTNETIQVKGETLDSTQKWTHFYKIKDTKDFIMLYHAEMVATLLDKKMFSETELQEFRRFIKSLDVIRE